MVNLTVADVKKLRELTGSGMRACKNALVKIDGGFDKAVGILRIKGAKDVSRRAEHTAAEGLIAVPGNIMVEVSSEADFVTKSQEFIDFTNKVADATTAVKVNSPEEFTAADLDGQTIAGAAQELSTEIGEKLELCRATTLEGDNIAVYLHCRAAGLPAAVGVLAAYTGEGEGAIETAHATAMWVATLKAQYLSREGIPADHAEAEHAVYEKITREKGKPEQAIVKIIEGRLNGLYKDVVLLERPSIADNKKTVKQPVDEASVTLTGFVRFETGQY